MLCTNNTSYSIHDFCRYLNMDSRFSHLRQRDTSVSMLRVKMSRRRSRSQKENRERAVNTRRQLEKLPELEVSSLDASIAMANMSVIQEKTLNDTKLAKSKTKIFHYLQLQPNKLSFDQRNPQ